VPPARVRRTFPFPKPADNSLRTALGRAYRSVVTWNQPTSVVSGLNRSTEIRSLTMLASNASTGKKPCERTRCRVRQPWGLKRTRVIACRGRGSLNADTPSRAACPAAHELQTTSLVRCRRIRDRGMESSTCTSTHPSEGITRERSFPWRHQNYENSRERWGFEERCGGVWSCSSAGPLPRTLGLLAHGASATQVSR
jgi:hypothetical protein